MEEQSPIHFDGRLAAISVFWSMKQDCVSLPLKEAACIPLKTPSWTNRNGFFPNWISTASTTLLKRSRLNGQMVPFCPFLATNCLFKSTTEQQEKHFSTLKTANCSFTIQIAESLSIHPSKTGLCSKPERSLQNGLNFRPNA